MVHKALNGMESYLRLQKVPDLESIVITSEESDSTQGRGKKNSAGQVGHPVSLQQPTLTNSVPGQFVLVW